MREVLMLDGSSVRAQSADHQDTTMVQPAVAGPARSLRRPADRLPAARPCRQRASRRKERAAFLDALARTGDPGQAAQQAGLPLLQLYRHRDADPVFAADWQAALGYAWEQVETRVLAALLQRLQQEATDPAVGAKSGLLDSRLVLAIVTGRDKPVTRSGAQPVDGPSVARLRAELRALADRQIQNS
ncbi:MAG: hypothetical protein MUE77_04895 [Sandarakinorhabdus sp.]|jgi:hypothetical protein|nr:hypothetical protein [Sandarakinorhabdus sp.]